MLRPGYILLLTFAVLLGCAAGALGQIEVAPASEAESAAEPPVEVIESVDPHERVRAGNALLEEGKAAEALQAYNAAAEDRPDAAEIAFDQGLSHYELGEYAKARQAFERARLSDRRSVQQRAQYAYGACDHAEALTLKDPKETLAKLESAMRQYQDVLAQNVDEDASADPESAFVDEAVRDAYFKAGTTWRAIKEMLEQQKQQQNQESDNQQEQSQEQQDQQSEQQDQQSEQQEQEQQAQPQQESQEQQEQQEQQQAQAQAGQQDEQQEPQQASAAEQEQQEQASREQALRELRRLMDRQRQRQEQRQETLPPLPLRPVEKDW